MSLNYFTSLIMRLYTIDAYCAFYINFVDLNLLILVNKFFIYDLFFKPTSLKENCNTVD